MIRRFVNVVAESHKTGAHSLHRLDIHKHLFHQSRADARVVPCLAEGHGNSFARGDEQPMLDSLEELPAPCVKIHTSFRKENTNKIILWGLLSPRSSEDKFFCMNREGNTMLCHANRGSVDPMPPLRDDMGLDPISFSVARPDAQAQEEDLYVIPNVPPQGGGNNNPCVRIFRKDTNGWRWESLPVPTFVGVSRHAPKSFIYSCTVVDGGRTLCFSGATPDIGTYCFNTVAREWRHAGDWLLPFVGMAEHVPDLALWLGFSPCSSSHYLCGTSDLNAMSMERAPKLEFVWQDLVTPQNWFALLSQLVSLGSGRFCIAKYFVIEKRRTGKYDDEWWKIEDQVIVLTGIEVGRDSSEMINVWKHKSIQYRSLYKENTVLTVL